MKNLKALAVTTLVAGAVFSPLVAHAINADATDFSVLPPGSSAFLLYYQHAESDHSYALGTRQPGNPRLTTDIGIVRAVHYMNLGPLIVAPQAYLPFGKLDAGRDIAALGSRTGVGDLTFLAPVWFTKPGDKTQFAIAPYLTLPTGQYNKSSALNLGSNRWAFDLQLGFAHDFTDKISFSLATDVQWFSNNNNYGSGSQTLKERPLYNFQPFLIYKFIPRADVSISVQRIAGGKEYAGGVSQQNGQAATKLQIGGAYWITPRKQQILITYGRDISVHNGFKEANRINMRFVQLF